MSERGTPAGAVRCRIVVAALGLRAACGFRHVPSPGMAASRPADRPRCPGSPTSGRTTRAARARSWIRRRRAGRTLRDRERRPACGGSARVRRFRPLCPRAGSCASASEGNTSSSIISSVAATTRCACGCTRRLIRGLISPPGYHVRRLSRKRAVRFFFFRLAVVIEHAAHLHVPVERHPHGPRPREDLGIASP